MMRLMNNWLDDHESHEQRSQYLRELDTQSTSDHIYLDPISMAVVFRPSHQIGKTGL